MKIYYKNQEYTEGKKKILAVNYDRDDFSWNNTINIPYSVLTIDEVDPQNKEICIDLARTSHKADEFGEGKYFIDTNGDLAENEGWEEYYEEI